MTAGDETWQTTVLRWLEKCWSRETSSRWCAEAPATGQCGVTALVIQDAYGGEILKTRLDAGWHFYNRLNGTRLDFTAGQFTEPPDYADLPSSREEAFADTNASQYGALAAAFRSARVRTVE
jgi:xanthine dehydrogenase iron-sulfur cluster and FAD-binding subunit A